jgi:hypothetical protein
MVVWDWPPASSEIAVLLSALQFRLCRKEISVMDSVPTAHSTVLPLNSVIILASAVSVTRALQRNRNVMYTTVD